MFSKNSENYENFISDLLHLKYSLAKIPLESVPHKVQCFIEQWEPQILTSEKNGRFLMIPLQNVQKSADSIVITRNTSSIPLSSEVYLNGLEKAIEKIIKDNI